MAAVTAVLPYSRRAYVKVSNFKTRLFNLFSFCCAWRFQETRRAIRWTSHGKSDPLKFKVRLISRVPLSLKAHENPCKLSIQPSISMNRFYRTMVVELRTYSTMSINSRDHSFSSATKNIRRKTPCALLFTAIPLGHYNRTVQICG